jgi:hypothetical protein
VSSTPGPLYATSMRGIQYDTVAGRYVAHIVGEVMPQAAQAVKVCDVSVTVSLEPAGDPGDSIQVIMSAYFRGRRVWTERRAKGLILESAESWRGRVRLLPWKHGK